MTDPYAPKSVYREKATRLKGDYCHICGNQGDTQVHHIDASGPHNLSATNDHIHNLLPLCPYCHRKVHSTEPDGDSIYATWAAYVDDESSPSDCEAVSYVTKDDSRYLEIAELDTRWERGVFDLGVALGRRAAELANICEDILEELSYDFDESVDVDELHASIEPEDGFISSRDVMDALVWLDFEQEVDYNFSDSVVSRRPQYEYP